MSEKDVYSNSNTQLDIMDEAIDLINAARRETYQLTFAEALEIMKIQRLDKIGNKLDGVGLEIDALFPTLQDISDNIGKKL